MIVIQLGNRDQCQSNGLEDWEHGFGIQPKGYTKSKNRYNCYNPNEADMEYRNQICNWSVSDDYRNNFKLELIY